MGCWGFASDENDLVWDEMPTLDKNDESRLVNNTASKDSRYGGVWRRNLATSDIAQFMSDVNEEQAFEEGTVPDTFKWYRTSLGCVIFLLKVGCCVPRKFLMTAQHVLQDETVAETYPDNINERKETIVTELNMISRALSNGGKLPGDPIGVRGLFCDMSKTDRIKHGFTTQLDEIEILNDDLSKLHDSLILKLQAENLLKSIVNTDNKDLSECRNKWIGEAGDIRDYPDGPMIGLLPFNTKFTPGWQNQSENEDTKSNDDAKSNDIYRELYKNKSEKLRLMLSKYKSNSKNLDQTFINEIDKNIIKHAATNLKTALEFESEAAITNASVYTLKIFDMLIGNIKDIDLEESIYKKKKRKSSSMNNMQVDDDVSYQDDEEVVVSSQI